MMKYSDARPLMDTGDLLLFRSDGLLGEAIRLFSHANVNHAALIMRIRPYETDEHRLFIAEALEHGIVMSVLSKRLKDFDGKVFWYPLNDETAQERQAIGERALQWLGTPYRLQGAF